MQDTFPPWIAAVMTTGEIRNEGKDSLEVELEGLDSLEFDFEDESATSSALSAANATDDHASTPSHTFSPFREIANSRLRRWYSEPAAAAPEISRKRLLPSPDDEGQQRTLALHPRSRRRESVPPLQVFPQVEIQLHRYLQCDICTLKFDSEELVEEHRGKHLDGDDFLCLFQGCGKQYATAEGLRLHVRNVHVNGKKWRCLAQGCARNFVRQSDLRMHIMRMHSNIRPFPCSEQKCSKSFAGFSELRRHMKACHNLVPCEPSKELMQLNAVDNEFIRSLMFRVPECENE